MKVQIMLREPKTLKHTKFPKKPLYFPQTNNQASFPRESVPIGPQRLIRLNQMKLLIFDF